MKLNWITYEPMRSFFDEGGGRNYSMQIASRTGWLLLLWRIFVCLFRALRSKEPFTVAIWAPELPLKERPYIPPPHGPGCFRATTVWMEE